MKLCTPEIADEEVEAEPPNNVTMDMLYQEIKGLRCDIGEVFKRHAMVKARVADDSWKRPRIGTKTARGRIGGGSGRSEQSWKVDARKSRQVDRGERIRFHRSEGVDVFAHSTCMKGTTKGIIGAAVLIKVIEDSAREKGKCKAVEVRREYDYRENVARGKLEEATAEAVKAV